MTQNQSKEGPKEAKDAQPRKVDPTFEDALTELGGLVEQLERGDLSLEASLAAFEHGVTLARNARTKLDEAQSRVDQLLGFDPQGKAQVQPLNVEEGPTGKSANKP